MIRFNGLTKDTLVDVLKEYDHYIQNANDDNRYAEGWFPVCINEFYDHEYQAILEERESTELAAALISGQVSIIDVVEELNYRDRSGNKWNDFFYPYSTTELEEMENNATAYVDKAAAERVFNAAQAFERKYNSSKRRVLDDVVGLFFDAYMVESFTNVKQMHMEHGDDPPDFEDFLIDVIEQNIQNEGNSVQHGKEENALDYSTMIARIMKGVQDGSTEPFIVYRDGGGWKFAHTQNQYGESFEWVEDIKDPCAVTFSGADFALGSEANVYDRILNERLRAEYEYYFLSEADGEEMEALMCFLEENIGAFSCDVTDYLTSFDRPFAMLYDMTPICLKDANPDNEYDIGKGQDFAFAVEDFVRDRLNNRRKRTVDVVEHENAHTEAATPEKASRKTKTSVLARIDDGKRKAAQADAARAVQDTKPPARKRSGQQQGD
jgi:hypothetical protein